MILGIAAFSYPVNLLLDNYKVIVLWGLLELSSGLSSIIKSLSLKVSAIGLIFSFSGSASFFQESFFIP